MKILLTVITAFSAAAVLPSMAFAATYQYVSYTGDIMTTIAPDAQTAIMTAPSIAATSGVLLIDEADDALPATMDVPIDPTPPVTP